MPAITPDQLPLPLADKTWTAHKPQLAATPYVRPHTVPATWVLQMSVE